MCCHCILDLYHLRTSYLTKQYAVVYCHYQKYKLLHFWHRFKAVAEHNCWTWQEKSTYLTTVLQDQATDMLHRLPKGVTYEEKLEALEDRFRYQHLAAAYRSQLKTRTYIVAWNPCKNLPQPLNSSTICLLNRPLAHRTCPHTTWGPHKERGKQSFRRQRRRLHHKNPAAAGRREDGEWGSQAGLRNTGSAPSRQAPPPKNERQDILGESIAHTRRRDTKWWACWSCWEPGWGTPPPPLRQGMNHNRSHNKFSRPCTRHPQLCPSTSEVAQRADENRQTGRLRGLRRGWQSKALSPDLHEGEIAQIPVLMGGPVQMMWCTRSRGTLNWGWWWYTWTGSHLIRELLRRSGLKEGAAAAVGE
jgi:hypothetical protein